MVLAGAITLVLTSVVQRGYSRDVSETVERSSEESDDRRAAAAPPTSGLATSAVLETHPNRMP